MRNEQLRIALVTTFPPGTGTLNEYAYHFVKALRTKPDVAEVILLTDELPDSETYEEDNLAENGASLRIIPCWRFDALSNVNRLVRTVRQVKPDVVLFNIQFATFGGGKLSASLGLLAPLAIKKLLRIRTIVLLHNIMETVDLHNAGYASNPVLENMIRLFGNIVTRALLTADFVALTIPKYVEILRQKYNADNVLLAPHGSFEEIAAPVFDASDGKQRVMTFGKFGTYKRVEPLIEAFAYLKANNHPDLQLVIAGSDSPNAIGYLNQVQNEYAHVPDVMFTGYVAEEDVPRLFQEATVTVFPYTSTTGSSGVLHQAGSYGKAAVLPLIGDFAEVIAEEGYASEFFEPGNVDSMAQAIAHVIDDPEHRRALGVQNFMASNGIPIADVVDWYLLHIETL